jgi:hypothetical protein
MHIDFFCFLDRSDLWSSITELARERGRSGGVYRIHAFRDEAPRTWQTDNLIPVNRASDADILGRLYIGSAEVMTAGFIMLWRSLGEARGSPLGLKEGEGPGRAWRESLVLRRRFPRLCFTLRFDPRPSEAQAEELADYLACFGELPPLNAALLDAPGWTTPGGTRRAPMAAIA